MLDVYGRQAEWSNGLLADLRARLAEIPSAYSVVTVGSVARREACQASDLDYFVLCPSGQEGKDTVVHKTVAEAIRNFIKQPAQNGPFAQSESIATMLAHIGGEKDANSKITRRMLFLLEGEWLTNPDMFDVARSSLIKRYIRDDIPAEKIARFLLNDIIRYYRTISVDFEHKTGEDEKSWGDRYAKLIFPMKLIYFSGIFAVAETRGVSAAEKRSKLTLFMKLSPIERMIHICGPEADIALEHYDRFLDLFGQEGVRDELKMLTSERRHASALFAQVRDMGHRFDAALRDLLRKKYAADHPIHAALLA